MARRDAQDPGAQDSAPRIPAAAAAIVALLNTRPHATPQFPDTLADPEKSAAVLRPFGHPDCVPPSPERIAAVRAVRSTLMDLVSAPSEQAWAALNQHAATVTLRQDFSAPGRVQLHPLDGDPVLGAILLTVGGLITDGLWPRLRICAGETCHGVFYDPTRSRNQRWHSYETCGNRANVAAFRSRRRAPDSVG
ncbi:CGNR zinc finger domain-containing protein [Actinacidiphila acididurans]|uniref:CGNR zinc finger domain-containing protein n=1 Tax=Actinacidiphila acididurans TaxID=2784346 RepID=A0ABS2TX49_9ACTN|nr:CGNR zinc finger domain-containing protein [Actinacidiphila acididurans]MBM9507918.1 CGNR zinc finger domain-containing protein [Actinacidiphila acididurans]